MRLINRYICKELASHSLLPVIRAYFKGTGVEVETADISLAGRIAANFPERLRDEHEHLPGLVVAEPHLADLPLRLARGR